MIGLQSSPPPVGNPAMSYFPGAPRNQQEEYNQVRHSQANLALLSSNAHQYRETGNGYRSPESISPYRSPAMVNDYSPSPSGHYLGPHISSPPGGTDHNGTPQNQVASGRTNSIVARMEGIEVSSNRGDAVSPHEGSAHRHTQDKVGLVDGRGNGDVVMQGSNEGAAANARRNLPDGRIGVLPPDAPRNYTAVKLVGDGSFGTVWLCDWASPLAPETKLSAMQCGAGARPDWIGKRLVAVKRMKRVWEGGWQQASQLGELVSLRDLATHPAIIPLYDAFLLPDTKELYFVFECMEGNLYQLTKSRKGRSLAGGLVASIFHQVVGGLHHIHKSGYFHRDMKPENLLVTTTGLQDYLPVIDPENQVADQAMRCAGIKPPERPKPVIETDVAVIVKLADFGLARSLESAPPYTEYVSTRWYRAPEVLLRSKEYSAPVDLWALGTIMAELVNLKAFFPGQSEVDQVWRICEILGDPSAEYGLDERGRIFGGGEWIRGIKMAKAVGFAFPKKKPAHFAALFPPSTPISLVDCIQDLLRYNPKARLTAEECMNHPYFHLTLPHLRAVVQLPEIPFSKGQPSIAELESLLRDIDCQRVQPAAQTTYTHEAVPPRSLPPSHSASPVHGKSAFGGQDGRTLPPPKISPEVRPYYQSTDRASAYGSAYSLHAPQGPENPNALSASSSQTMLNMTYTRPNRGGASALVDQLRELDLPTDALSTFGRRPIPSELAPQETTINGSGLSRIVPPPLHHPGGFTNAVSPLDRNTNPYAAPSGSASSLSFRSNPSDSQLPAIPYQRSHLPPHMATPTTLISGQQPQSPYDTASHYVSQRSFEASAPTLASMPEDVDMVDTSTSPARRPDPQIAAQSSHALPISSKKKKWGLSSVFGGGHEKQQSSVPIANIVPLVSNSSLKRTQSGAKATDRFQSEVTLPPSQLDVGTITDPKKAKKEAERQAKELEKAKREAMERAQKERARAVMQKRTQLEQQRKMAGSKSELEWNHVHGTSIDKRSEAAHSSKTSNTSGTSVPRLNPDSSRPPSLYQQTGSYSSFSAHSGESSGRLQKLSEHNLRQTQILGVPEIIQDHDYRAKARRRNDNDDHSTSGYSVPSLINPSMLTVDSDPGPGGTRRMYPLDHRAASNSSLGHRYHHSGSNASVDGQLARDFQTHASLTVHPGSGPFVGSPTGGYAFAGTSVSGPTTPYGHSAGQAVSGGIGLGRHVNASIPSLFRENVGSEPVGLGTQAVYHKSPNTDGKPHITLPPFSAIASVAGGRPKPNS